VHECAPHVVDRREEPAAGVEKPFTDLARPSGRVRPREKPNARARPESAIAVASRSSASNTNTSSAVWQRVIRAFALRYCA
jgi:hypothetical protein